MPPTTPKKRTADPNNQPTKIENCHQPDCKGACMEPAATYSPLPWKVSERSAFDIKHTGIVDDYDRVVCRMDFLDEEQANAAYIVRAVNSHAELLEALKQLANITNRHGKNLVINQIVNQAWDAISKAEGK